DLDKRNEKKTEENRVEDQPKMPSSVNTSGGEGNEAQFAEDFWLLLSSGDQTKANYEKWFNDNNDKIRSYTEYKRFYDRNLSSGSQFRKFFEKYNNIGIKDLRDLK